jgi:hypothetical protein
MLLALLSLSAVTSVALAQIPADGWSGQVQCVIAVRAPGYQDDQTHTWILSGPPIARNDFRDYPATWTVAGGGSRTLLSVRATAAGAGDTWTRNGSDPSAQITLFAPISTNNLRIASGQRAVKAIGGIRGTAASAPFTAEVAEWRFQYIDISGGAVQTSLSGSRPQTRTDLIGWRQPPGATVTETCTWNLTKQGQSSVSSRPQLKDLSSGARFQNFSSSSSASTPTQATDLRVTVAPKFVTGVGTFGVPTAEWHVTFLNAGPDAANGATVAAYDGSPGLMNTLGSVSCYGARGVSCPASVGPANAAQGIPISVWPAGGEVHLLVATDVRSKVGGSAVLDAVATPSANATDPSPSDNVVEATYPVAATSARPKADLGIGVAAAIRQTSNGPALQVQNGQATFLVVVQNSGPDWADGARVVVPSGSPKYAVNCTASQGAVCPSGGITGAQIEAGVGIPIFPSGGRVEFHIRVGVPEPGPVGLPPVIVGMSATVTPPSSTDDTRSDNNSGSITFPVVAP